jgi:CBS domain containing-hemolysin-like protein
MGTHKSLKDWISGKKRRGEDIPQAVFDSLEKEQKEMIRGVVELPDTTVKEVMVPRTDTVFIDADTPPEELLKTITESGHSRFPVYKDTLDNVIGVLYVKDVLRAIYGLEEKAGGLPALDAVKQTDINSLVRKAYFIPLSKHIDELLRELRRKRVHIAIVVDEYGGVAGIVSMEDILEEIIGDIQDEFDHETEDIVKLGEGAWLCDARVNLEDLAEKTGIEFPLEDFDTLGGFVFDLLGKIPVKFEKVSHGGYDFIVQDMEGHKINSIKIVARKEEPDDSGK